MVVAQVISSHLVLVNRSTATQASEVLELQVLTSVATTTATSLGASDGVHELEGQVSHQFTTNGTAGGLDAHGVGNDDTTGVSSVLALSHHGGGGKVGIGVLQLAVESNADLALVGGGERSQVEVLGEVGAWGDGAALLRLQGGDLTGEVVVGHGDLNVLHNGALEVLDSLLAAIVDVDLGGDLLTVIVDLLVQGHLHVHLTGGESKALGHQGGGLALGDVVGAVLHLAHSQSHGVALVCILVGGVTNEHAQLVDDTNGLGGLITGVQLDGGGGSLRDRHSEGVGVTAQLLHEAILNAGGLPGGLGWVDLLGCKLHFLAEVEAHDLILLAAISVGDIDGSEDLAASEVGIVANYDAIDGLNLGEVVDEVATT